MRKLSIAALVILSAGGIFLLTSLQYYNLINHPSPYPYHYPCYGCRPGGDYLALPTLILGGILVPIGAAIFVYIRKKWI